MSGRPLLVATRSAGKLEEIRTVLREAGFDPVDLEAARIAEREAEDTLERAATFEENALSKARYFHRLSGLDTVADDSGIEVVALGGAPGVRSKRWSERPGLTGVALDLANNALLMERLSGIDDRRARYVCAAAFCGIEGEFVERGEVAGLITRAPRGSNGFGYDPYFESTELSRTFGEARAEEKASVSHRARAFAKLLRRLAARV